MPDEFIYCPNCGSKKISETDYEDENGDEDTDGRACDDCNWEGDCTELVCKDDEPNDSTPRGKGARP